jgi:hypothetical protein
MNPYFGFIFLHLFVTFNVQCDEQEVIRVNKFSRELKNSYQYTRINLTETQAALYKRIKATKLIINPYNNLFINQSEMLFIINSSKILFFLIY